MKQIPPTGAIDRDRDLAIRELIDGHGNHSGTVTLRANQVTTTVTKSTINLSAHISLSPTTASAATAVFFVNVPAAGSFVITHDSSAATDRVFSYAVVGG
jgi:hypothetical protein